jgi:parvulin-like peptidyl-prolyl isomerase
VFAAELDEVAFALQPGQIGEPVAVDESVYVVRVVEREAARPLALELLLHLQQLRFDDWMEELRAKAVIERFVGE